MRMSISSMDDSKHEDIFWVHSEANGADWRYCVARWAPTWQGWGWRTAEENRKLRGGLFRQGQYDGYLLYLNGNPVGWCQWNPGIAFPSC